MRVMIAGAAAGLVLALVSGPAGAENPRVHLKLENVTAAEAAEALSKAASVEVSVVRGGMPDPRLQEKASFDWSDSSLGTALRQLSQRYSLQLAGHLGGRFQLFPVAAPRQAGPHQNLVEKNGVRLFLRGISVHSSRNVNFDGQMSFDSGNMSINFGAEIPDGDPETIVGLDAVSARDDQGNILTPDNTQFLPRSGFGFSTGFPDEWNGSVALPSPHPKARKLLWLEGDLLVYKTFRRRPLELLVAEKGKPQQFRGATVELSRFDTTPVPAKNDPNIQDIRAEIQITAPSEVEFLLNRSLQFRLVGKSGKQYTFSGSGMSSGGDGLGWRMRLQGDFRSVPEPVDRVVLLTVETGAPQRLFSFRMTNVPLPSEAPFVPRRAPEPRHVNGANVNGANVPVRTSDFAFRQADGGAIVSRIRVGERPVPEGVLSIGLAAKDGAGWGPIRWVDVDVDAHGQARLEQVKPGVYQVTRVFRVKKEALPLPPGGRWQNAEVIVTVVANKDLSVPPLAWAVPAPATRRR